MDGKYRGHPVTSKSEERTPIESPQQGIQVEQVLYEIPNPGKSSPAKIWYFWQTDWISFLVFWQRLLSNNTLIYCTAIILDKGKLKFKDQ